MKKIGFDDRSPWFLAYDSQVIQKISILTKLFLFPSTYLCEQGFSAWKQTNKKGTELINPVLLQQ